MHETRRKFRNAEFHSARLRLRASMGVAVLLALVCGLVCASPSRSQSSGGSNGGQGQGQGQGSVHPFSQPQDVSALSPDDADPAMVERRIRALNIERQKQIVADTDKLLKLARELNEEVAKANAGTLTMDELHKIADIEKLARNVRQRMTESVGEPQTSMPTQVPMVFPNH
ncbi:MAG: hypothetical protein ABSA42_01810 [Terracidiphilus sp.]|jgi:hypothetical protein